MSDAPPMTDATEVDAAVERLKAYTGYPGQSADMRTILADHARQAAEIERLSVLVTALKDANENKKGLIEIATDALSEHKAVLAEVTGSVLALFANPMTMPPEQRVKFERVKSALTRAAALMEKDDG